MTAGTFPQVRTLERRHSAEAKRVARGVERAARAERLTRLGRALTTTAPLGSSPHSALPQWRQAQEAAQTAAWLSSAPAQPGPAQPPVRWQPHGSWCNQSARRQAPRGLALVTFDVPLTWVPGDALYVSHGGLRFQVPPNAPGVAAGQRARILLPVLPAAPPPSAAPWGPPAGSDPAPAPPPYPAPAPAPLPTPGAGGVGASSSSAHQWAQSQILSPATCGKPQPRLLPAEPTPAAAPPPKSKGRSTRCGKCAGTARSRFTYDLGEVYIGRRALFCRLSEAVVRRLPRVSRFAALRRLQHQAPGVQGARLPQPGVVSVANRTACLNQYRARASNPSAAWWFGPPGSLAGPQPRSTSSATSRATAQRPNHSRAGLHGG